MSVDPSELTLATMLLALAWFLCTRLLRLSIISPALGYWAGWISVGATSWYCQHKGWLSFDPDSLGYVLNAHLFALLGIISADFITAYRIPRRAWPKLRLAVTKLDAYSTLFLLALFLVGLALLGEQIRSTGISLDYFTAAREQHLLREESVVKRIGSQIGIIANVIAILFGIRDALNRVSMKSIAIMIFASAPAGFSSASRIFLLNYTLFYVASVLVFRSRFMRNSSALAFSEIRSLFYVLLGSLTAFALIGFIRGGYGDELSIVYNIMVWPSSTLSVVDDWAREAMASPLAYGSLTLGYFSDLMSQMGLDIFVRSGNFLVIAQDSFLATRNSALYVPRSYVPDLIFDFGDTYYVLGSFVLLAILQFAYRMLRGGDVLSHTLSVVLVYAAFMTIQNPPFTPWNIATVFWAAVIGFGLQRTPRSMNETNAL